MLKKELRKILLSLSFVFVAAVSCAQYVVTGGSGSPMKATQSSGDSAERLEVYLVYGMDNVTISYTSSSLLRINGIVIKPSDWRPRRWPPPKMELLPPFGM